MHPLMVFDLALPRPRARDHLHAKIIIKTVTQPLINSINNVGFTYYVSQICVP